MQCITRVIETFESGAMHVQFQTGRKGIVRRDGSIAIIFKR